MRKIGSKANLAELYVSGVIYVRLDRWIDRLVVLLGRDVYGIRFAGVLVDSGDYAARLVPILFASVQSSLENSGVVAEHVRHAIYLSTAADVEQSVERKALERHRVAPAASPVWLNRTEINRRRSSCLRQPA